MECYFDWHEFFEVTRILLVRRKLVGSARTYWDLIVRDCVRRSVVIEYWEEIKEKLKKTYLSEYYRNRLLDQLHNFLQGDMSVQNYIDKFENLNLHYDVREHQFGDYN